MENPWYLKEVQKTDGQTEKYLRTINYLIGLIYLLSGGEQRVFNVRKLRILNL